MLSSADFLSVVVVVEESTHCLIRRLECLGRAVAGLVSDYEIIVVDNASEDMTLRKLEEAVGEKGLANLQIYALGTRTSQDAAAWVGCERALGDFVVVMSLYHDDIGHVCMMLEQAHGGCDVVFADSLTSRKQSWAYNLAKRMFYIIYAWSGGPKILREASTFRLLSKRMVSFILQHPQPAMAYRFLPASGEFAMVDLVVPSAHYPTKVLTVGSVERGVRLLVATTRAPMRTITLLCLFGSVWNFCYSVYVVVASVFNDNPSSAWISLSLQQSAMFLLLSLAVVILGEYVLYAAAMASDCPSDFIRAEFTSTRLVREQRLNIDEGEKYANDEVVAPLVVERHHKATETGSSLWSN